MKERRNKQLQIFFEINDNRLFKKMSNPPVDFPLELTFIAS